MRNYITAATKAALAAYFTLFAGTASSQAPAANYTLTRDSASLENVFSGHYGESLRMSQFWIARAELQGSIEVVYFHPDRVDPLKHFSPPYKPGNEEFVPENFGKLRLIQMKVIPKKGGPRSMKELRDSREKELAEAGVQAKFQTPVGLGSWPADSFQVMISTPYTLFQAYAAGGEHFFVMTSGTSPYLETTSDPTYLRGTETLLFSLLNYLDRFHVPLGSIAEPLTGLAGAFIPGALSCAIGFALLSFPGSYRRAKLAGRAILSMTIGWHLLGVPILLASWRFGWGRNVNEASLAICAALLTPCLCREASTRFGGEKSWRVFWFAAAASALPLIGAMVVFSIIHAMEAPILNAGNFGRLSRVAGFLGFLNGIAFAFSHREADKPSRVQTDAA